MQEQTITALCAALTAQQLPFAQGEPLAPHTTFKIGGPAAFWCTPRDAEQLRRTLQLCRENGVRVYLLGNGSNTLFDDAGFDGAVIDMRGLSGMENSGLDTDAVRITAGAGQTLGRLCSKAQTLGLTGLEFACGIPGTVGGALSRTPTGASYRPRWCCTAVTEPLCWPVCRSCWASAGKSSPLNGRVPAAPSSGPRARLRAS